MDTQNNLPYFEVVDTFGDAVEVAQIVEERLADGADFGDIIGIYNAYPRLLEIYQDRQTFWAQFTDLTVEETTQVYDELAQRFGQDRDKIETYVLSAYDIAAETYALVDYNIRAVQSIGFKAKMLFSGAQAA